MTTYEEVIFDIDVLKTVLKPLITKLAKQCVIQKIPPQSVFFNDKDNARLMFYIDPDWSASACKGSVIVYESQDSVHIVELSEDDLLRLNDEIASKGNAFDFTEFNPSLHYKFVNKPPTPKFVWDLFADSLEHFFGSAFDNNKVLKFNKEQTKRFTRPKA